MTDAQQNPEEPRKQELSAIPKPGKQGALSLPATAEQMQEVADRLASVQEMLKKLPGTIGAAVADALSRPKNASGPPVPMAAAPADIEFGKGQAMRGGGKVITEGIALPTPKAPFSKKLGTRPIKR